MPTVNGAGGRPPGRGARSLLVVGGSVEDGLSDGFSSSLRTTEAVTYPAGTPGTYRWGDCACRSLRSLGAVPRWRGQGLQCAAAAVGGIHCPWRPRLGHALSADDV